MAEPIRKPVHRPRPPHPHIQKRPAVLVHTRVLPEEPDLEETLYPQAAPAPRPALVPKQRRPQPVPPPPPPLSAPEASVAPLVPPPAGPQEEKSARGWLRIALALHLLILVAAWFDQPASGLAPEDLLLAGIVLLSGGTMLVAGGAKR